MVPFANLDTDIDEDYRKIAIEVIDVVHLTSGLCLSVKDPGCELYVGDTIKDNKTGTSYVIRGFNFPTVPNKLDFLNIIVQEEMS